MGYKARGVERTVLVPVKARLANFHQMLFA